MVRRARSYEPGAATEIARKAPFHLLSIGFIGVGFVLISVAWNELYRAQSSHSLAKSGVYSHVRHPQYVGFIVVMFGFLLQWPTLLTILMFPVLVYMYVRLARAEEAESLREFGGAYEEYMREVPAFIPRFGGFIDGSHRPAGANLIRAICGVNAN